MTKEEVAGTLDEIATLMELKGENVFRVKAYQNAARALEQLPDDLATIIANQSLSAVRGIGDSMAEKITTLARTGELEYLTKLREEIPEGLVKMLRLPGVGPKKVKALYDTLGIKTLDELKLACENGSVAKLKGFGAKTQEKILTGLAFLSEVGQRVRFDQAYPLGLALLEQLSQMPGVIRSALCGSLRRRRETSKDIDILLSSDLPGPIMDAFVHLPEVLQITGHGETKSSIVAALQLGNDRVVLNADLRIVRDEFFPFALMHFTGSKEHNIRLRSRALERGLSLSEYGLTGEGKTVPAKDEAEIYKALDLVWLPPEMREDTGEVELSEKGTVPKLIVTEDIRGVFHNHSTWSDGSASLEEMALAAKVLGLEYFGIGDHSQSLRIARGLTTEAVLKQHREIDTLNDRLDGIRIIKGIECDILEDGSLDYDDTFLKHFEYVVVSVHTHFNMTSEEMTARIRKALEHPATTMLGHATGRLLLRREGYKVDLGKVMETAARNGKMIEINAQPSRLDLDWVHVKRAKELGIPLVINPDAHSPEEIGYIRYGIDVARRGWLTKQDVFNTRSLAQVMAELKKRKAG